MKNRRRVLLGLLLVALIAAGVVAWWYCWRQPPFKMVVRGGSAFDPKFGVSGGNCIVQRGKPGILFGTFRKPGGQEGIAYVIVFRHHLASAEALTSCDGHSTADRTTAEAKDELTVHGQRVAAVYQLKLNEDATAVTTESLSVGGRPMDVAAGRVFLIDLTAATPVYRQQELKVPPIRFELKDTAEVERTAEAILGILAQDPEVKTWLR